MIFHLSTAHERNCREFQAKVVAITRPKRIDVRVLDFQDGLEERRDENLSFSCTETTRWVVANLFEIRGGILTSAPELRDASPRLCAAIIQNLDGLPDTVVYPVSVKPILREQ